MAEAMTSIYFM